jgi:cellulose synthase/poly-beta-1,6-N-acetylglucosamine synthase-like glycosyltransferase
VAPAVTIVIPVWDDYTELLPKCLRAIDREHVTTKLVVVNNASETRVDAPAAAGRVTLTSRVTIGAARNAGFEHVDTPYVVFADADDEIARGSLARALQLLERRPDACGVIGRSAVDRGEGRVQRGIRPTRLYRFATHVAPWLVPFLWLVGYQGSITSTVLRTRAVREAGGFADANMAEDWHLASRLARRGPFVCIDDPVRIYHRHETALRTREPRQSLSTQRRAVCHDCRADPASTRLQRLVAAALMTRSE